MLTKKDIYDIAVKQSAADSGCAPEDFYGKEYIVVESVRSEKARKYLELPFICDFTYYGSNIVASTRKEYFEEVGEVLARFRPEHIFETPNLYAVNDVFSKYGSRVCFLAEYFLPDPELMREYDCGYEIRILTQKDFAGLYLPQWSNALCEKRKELDVLGAGAYSDDGELIGLAGCSADCDMMWQIGVDVLPEYRMNGIARALTGKLASEILKRDKVPFYCAAWSNIKSVRNALSCGFRPAWAQMTVKENPVIEKMNRSE